jgi:hypothetical protein
VLDEVCRLRCHLHSLAIVVIVAARAWEQWIARLKGWRWREDGLKITAVEVYYNGIVCAGSRHTILILLSCLADVDTYVGAGWSPEAGGNRR